MRSETRVIHYCDFCGKHRHLRSAMEKHERGCTMNPDRVCRWSIGDEAHPEFVLRELASSLHERACPALAAMDIDWLREVIGGCPACMLAALRQSGVKNFQWGSDGGFVFKYEDEIERRREEEREHWIEEERREMYASMY